MRVPKIWKTPLLGWPRVRPQQSPMSSRTARRFEVSLLLHVMRSENRKIKNGAQPFVWGHMRTNAKIPRWTGGRAPPESPKIGIFGPKTPRDPSDDLGRSFGIIFSPKFQHPTMLVHNFHVFFEFVFEKHENRTFRASLEPWGPRDPSYVQ